MKITMRYGVDAPFWVAFLIIIGMVFTLLGVFGSVNGLVLGYGLICLVTGLWMFTYSTTIKIAHREVILSLAQAKSGDELLDVGTGRGLLAISASQRGCRVTATDVWSKWDLGGNGKDKLQANMVAESVAEIDIVDADARELPFSDGSFDVVVSNFVVHNIKSVEGRRKAILEMWRVLSPNGRLVISDFSKTAEYIQILNSVSNRIEIKQFFYTFPFSKAVVVQKI
ncbi:class I SAM-dependent methyltransferase [Bacillus cereus]|uniref:class I SAM-dependent methyltransferase n=1 Tax=Bacillus cereus TaxID=1396 RepID=UPI001879BE97|nr:class I SAM-dependent methyltransferase [Bacillus cereus]MBE7105448.1 class I SAM-dependent methyltransferase [Bacillus cereus]